MIRVSLGRSVSVLQLAAATLVGTRLLHGVARIRPIRPVAIGTHTVSVVIPARNEADRIGACVESVLRHASVKEVIVVDDDSSDDTARIASEAGARVIAARPLPVSWVGKPWALQCGLQNCSGEFVVFLDADVRLRVDAISALVSELFHFDVVTLSARLVTSSLLEQMLSASMVVTLVYRFGPVGRRTMPKPARVVGNGQCIAVRRAYLSSHGGFEAASKYMTDDIALLRSLARNGARIGFLDGSEVLDVQMYSSARETWHEWPRSLPMNDVTSIGWRFLDTATLWLTMALPVARLARQRSTGLDKLLIVQRFAIAAALLGSYRKPRIGVLLSPFADIAVLCRLTRTTLQPVRAWRGRNYAQPKSADR